MGQALRHPSTFASITAPGIELRDRLSLPLVEKRQKVRALNPRIRAQGPRQAPAPFVKIHLSNLLVLPLQAAFEAPRQ
jgi:hypothetical protein